MGNTTAMNWQAWRRHAERITSELLGVPVYVLLDDELPDGAVAGCWGQAWPEMARMLRDEIGTRWQGDGAAMILNTSAIERELAGQFVEDRPGTLSAMAFGVVAHETAHALEWPSLNGGGLAVGLCKEDFLVDIPSCSKNRIPCPSEHGPQFCWNALHILQRLELRGIEVCLTAMIDYEAFNLPRPAFVMRSTIRRELADMESLPMRLIARYPPPDEFVALFDADEIPETSAPHPLLKVKDMTAFFDQLESIKSSTAAKDQADWRALVRSVADGPEPDPTATLGTLQRLKKTPADLRVGVEKLRRRRQLSAQITDAHHARAGQPAIEDAIRVCDQTFAAARETHDATCSHLLSQLASVEAASTRAGVARDELERTANAALLDMLRENSAELDRAHRERYAVADRIDYAKSRGEKLRMQSLQAELLDLNQVIARLQKLDDGHRVELFDPESI